MLSIVIPASNAEDTIGELLESIKAQDFHDDYEVIIIDNGSKDKTEEIVKKYIDHLPIRYYKYEEKLGHAGAINEGISKAKGEYILILNANIRKGN
jgi:glycosyltransferase involved in cell wall biosynthesis